MGNAAGDVFNVVRSKTAAGVRRVPIHPDLRLTVATRSKGKPSTAYLFDELRAPPSRPTERSTKASERFTAYRRSMGVDARAEGQRNSSLNFHSWRHFFVTQALRAGQPREIVSAVVGHTSGREGVTLSVYNSQGPSLDQLRAVVEAVRLPDGAAVQSPAGPM